jgi:hypothetical protein
MATENNVNKPVEFVKPIVKEKKQEVKQAEKMVAVALDGFGNRIYVRESKVDDFKKRNNLK